MKKIIKSYFCFNALLMTADLLYRINDARNHIGMDLVSPIYIFYIFKLDSLVHLDANGSGVVILTILSVAFFMKLQCYDNKFYKRMYILFLMLLISTFARASIIAHFFMLLFTYFFVRRTIYTKIIVIIIICFSFLPIFMYFVTSDNFVDYSYLSKILIFSRTMDYLKDANTFQLLFGNGEQSSEAFINMGAHNFISALLIDSGLISLLLYIWLFISLAFDVKSGWYIVLLPFFITSLSYSPLTTPYIFIAALLIKHTKLKGIAYKRC